MRSPSSCKAKPVQDFLPFAPVAVGSDPDHAAAGLGTLIGLARRRVPRAAMETLSDSAITTAQGVVGDYRGKAKPDGRVTRRQVSLLRREDWTLAEAELACALQWTHRRANLFVEGLDLPRVAGTIVAIGDVRLAVSGECDPCRRMDEQHPGLWPALVPDWRGGYLMTVIAGGHVRLGDAVRTL
ncbi:MOSC domain-containing protein [Sphingomonas arantia]|uniref:MOSC domain-containing protein n=1 Tax=Sphingomonas arantia TaxID=1460676 RepID=A0ABW4U057_9SPHN